jgi:hypothetical protein
MSDKLQGGIKAGSTSVSLPVILRKTADNTENTGTLAANITAYYWRQGGTPTALTAATDLAAITSAFSAGGWKAADGTNQPGVYRLDVDDAAFATGADWVVISVKVASCYLFVEKYPLTTNVVQTGDSFARLGAPAGASVSADVAAVKADTAAIKTKTDFLPSATAGAAGGVFIAGSNAATTISGLTTGALSCTTITASGAVAFQSTFAVTTSTALAALSCTTLTASGAVAFQSTFIVTGAVTFSSTFATTGTTTFNAFTVTNATTLSGAVSLGSTLGVTGTTTLAAVNTGAIGTGNVTITGTLSTSGTATLNALTITNAFTVSGATTLTGAVTASNAGNNIVGVSLDQTAALTSTPVANSIGEALFVLDNLAGRINTAQAGSSTTITLDAGASSTDGRYVGYGVYLYGGTGGGIRGVGQERTIVAYVGSTKVATLAQPWGTVPDATSKFILYANPFTNVGMWNGTVVATPATAGIPDVNAKNWGNSVVTGMPMPTYTQPTGFLAATFPSGTIANTTNITAGVMTTVTTLTNLPAIPANWLTAAGIAASALNGKGDWLTVGGYTAPLSAAGTRAAVGLATANLDTQLAAIDADVMTRSAPATAQTIDQTTAVAMVDVTADGTVTVGKCLLSARAQAAGAWSIVGTTLLLKNPDGSTFRTFTLDSATVPTSRT